MDTFYKTDTHFKGSRTLVDLWEYLYRIKEVFWLYNIPICTFYFYIYVATERYLVTHIYIEYRYTYYGSL